MYPLGKSYELEVKDGAINATDVGKIKSPAGAVTRVYDPAYMNTVNCISKISFINGEKEILEYSGPKEMSFVISIARSHILTNRSWKAVK